MRVAVAPLGFVKEALSENVLAGPVMTRRAQYMYGSTIGRSARSHVDTGLGKGPAIGDVSIIAIPEHRVVGTIPATVVGNSPDDVIR